MMRAAFQLALTASIGLVLVLTTYGPRAPALLAHIIRNDGAAIAGLSIVGAIVVYIVLCWRPDTDHHEDHRED